MVGDADVDALYALDPAEFTAARDALVKQLKTAGDKDAAAAVKALRKPTKIAWAINQVARGRTDDVAALRDAGADLRDRQADALSGGDADALRSAVAHRRAIVQSLAADVVTLTGDASREEAAATFEAASVDDAIGAIVASGRLTTPAPRPSDMGFLGMPDLPSGTRSDTPRARPPGGRAAPAPKAGRAAATTAPAPLDRRRIRALERAAELADAAVERTSERLDDAEDAVQAAERDLADARLAAADAERAAETSRTARDAAAQASADAVRAADAARSEVDAARRP